MLLTAPWLLQVALLSCASLDTHQQCSSRSITLVFTTPLLQLQLSASLPLCLSGASLGCWILCSFACPPTHGRASSFRGGTIL